MSDARITDLTALTTPADGDVLPIVDVSDTTDGASGTTKKIAMSSIFPASSTNKAIPRFYGTTGKVIQDSGLILGDKGTHNAIFDISNVATSDKTFTLPNETGTLALRGANTFTTTQTISQTVQDGTNDLVINHTLNNSSAYGGIPFSLSLNTTDNGTNTRLSNQVIRLDYTKASTSTGESTATFDVLFNISSTFNASQTSTLYGFKIESPVVASGKTLSSWNAIRIDAPSGVGAITTLRSIFVEDNAGKLFLGNNAITAGPVNYAADAQASDTYVITLDPALASYVTGMEVTFKANTANTGAATLNVNSLGAKTIVKAVSTTLANNDILANMFCKVVYDGTNFVLLNPRTL